MMLEDARNAWASGGNENGEPTMSEAEIMDLVLRRSARLQRTVRWRDWRETIAAALGLLVLSPVLAIGPWLARVGVLLIAAGSALVIVRLRRARRLPRPRPEWPLAEAVRAERARVDAQIRLLETVLTWYVAPLMLGVVLVVAGLRGASWFTYGYILAIAALSAGIYAINRRASRRELRPRRGELDRLLAGLENG